MIDLLLEAINNDFRADIAQRVVCFDEISSGDL